MKNIATTSTSNIPTVADYIVARLAKLGITECFGVPGDFAFVVDNAIENNPDIQWIGCANELNAAYAADGYARIRGAAMICTTYGVGELSALNGVMGSKAEHLPVFHLVGMPSLRNQRLKRVVHHTLGDGIFQNFIDISSAACCVSAIITPYNCVQEMERVVGMAMTKKQPAYIVVAEDSAEMPIVPTTPSEWPALTSNPEELANAVTHLLQKINDAKAIVVLPGYTISRFGAAASLKTLIETLGVPFITLFMDKTIIPETHSQYLGQHSGKAGTPDLYKVLDDADLIIDAGGVLFSDINTLGFDDLLNVDKMISINPTFVTVDEKVYEPVVMKDLFDALAKQCTKKFQFKKPPLNALPLTGKSDEKHH